METEATQADSQLKKLALFDFDGTLTRKDTMIEFIRYVRGSTQLYLSYLILSPILVLYKLKLFPNTRAKQMLLRFHFGGKSRKFLEDKGKSFCERILPQLFQDMALEKLHFHRSKGHDVYVVSASLDLWILPWLKDQGLGYLCTEAAWKDDKFTGDLATPNCYGPEKVRRIKAALDTDVYDRIYAYGDSSGDKEMLEFADRAFYRTFL